MSAPRIETGIVAAFSRIVNVDLSQTINHVKSGLLSGQTTFGFDLFKQHSEALSVLHELIAAAAPEHDSDEKRDRDQKAVEALIYDIGLPFLQSFAPSYDGRTDLMAAVLKICDLIFVCLKRSSQKTAVEILELCLQSLVAYHRECTPRHSESSFSNLLDIICALELLCSVSDIFTLPDNICYDDLLHRIFSASLSILSFLEEKKANRLIAFVIFKLLQDQAEKRSTYMQEIWKTVESDLSLSETWSPKSLQQHLTMMCSLANFFFPLTETSVVPDVRQLETFWWLVQRGLYNDNPAVRKRSLYLMKRITDTCEKSNADFMADSSSSGSLPHFWWSVQHQKKLCQLWGDIILLLETLDEKQTHVIKPILPRMQAVIDAAKNNDGSQLLHTSWIATLLMRAFHHESVFIIRWAVQTVLFMDFTSLPFVEQNQLQFLTKNLLEILQDLKLYQRPDGSPVGSCTTVGSGLKQFFANVCQSLTSRHHKVEFLQQVLCTLKRENWNSVPLVFITQGLSHIPPDCFLDLDTLASVREIIIASLTTLETFTRGAIECFLTKTVLNLTDKSSVEIDGVMEVLGVMEREESVHRGTGMWGQLVSFLLTGVTDAEPPAWSWPALLNTLQALIDDYLAVTAEMTGNALSENVRVTKLGRLVALMADGEVTLRRKVNQDQSSGATQQSLLTSTVGIAVSIIQEANVRVYMPVLKADRAIYLLVSCAKELKKVQGDKDECREELCALVQSCWSELLQFVERRLLVTEADTQNSLDLDMVVFYGDVVRTLGEALPCEVGVSSLHQLCERCVAVLKSTSQSTLLTVAAMSLMSAVAETVERKRKMEREEKGRNNHEGLQHLLSHLSTFTAALTSHCPSLAANHGGGSAHYGRLVCQYMMSRWQCVRVTLSHDPSLMHCGHVLHEVMEAFSVSSGETDIPILQCLQLAMPQLVEQTDKHDELMGVMEVAWSKVHEEIKSWSFWLKMEAYVNMVLQTPLLTLMSSQDSQLGAYMTKVLKRFFEVGGDKSGLLNLVMGRLCALWGEGEGEKKGEGERGGGIALALSMVSTIVDACMFGTLHKKTERLWLDVCMYIETLKEECSVNEISSSSSKNDIYVRLMVVNFLSNLTPGRADHDALGRAVLEEVWGRYWDLAQISTFRQYTNTLPHRFKHRLVLVLPLLDSFMDQESCEQYFKRLWDALVVECHPSVRQNLEWTVMRLIYRFPARLLPSLWQYFNQFSDKRNVSLLSLLHIVSRIGPELPQHMQEEFYQQAIPQVVPWTMAHHFNTRLHGQASVYTLWSQWQARQLKDGQLQGGQLPDGQLAGNQFPIVHSCIKFLVDNGNSSAVLEKLRDNYFYSHFHFVRDFSMETLMYTLPRLSCISDDEWLHPDLFKQLDPGWQTDGRTRPLPLYNQTPDLARCQPGAWKMKATAETTEESSENTEGDVQKKIIPWRLMTPDSDAQQEYTCRNKARKSDGLVLVTSLINKIPNLGGLCRTSEIFGVSEFVINNLSYLNDRTFQSLSVTAEKWIPITEVQSFRLSEFLEEKKRESYTLVGVEQTANSVDLTHYTFPKKTLLLLGNEKEGIPPDLLQQLDVCVEIPQQGIIRSLNVHVSGALLVWEYTRQQMEHSE